MLVGSRAYSVNAQRWLKPFSDAFVEASPAGGAFTFTVGGGAGPGLAADETVAACGEGVFFGNLLKKSEIPFVFLSLAGDPTKL